MISVKNVKNHLHSFNLINRMTCFNRQSVVHIPNRWHPLWVFRPLNHFSDWQWSLSRTIHVYLVPHCNQLCKDPQNAQKGRNRHKRFNNSDSPATTEVLSVWTTRLLMARPPRLFTGSGTRKTETTTIVCAVRVSWNSHEGHGKPFIHLPLSSCTLTLSSERRGKKATVGRLPPRFPPSLAPLLIGGNAKKRRRAMNHRLGRRSIILPQQFGYQGEHCYRNDAWCCTLGHLCCWKCNILGRAETSNCKKNATK